MNENLLTKLKIILRYLGVVNPQVSNKVDEELSFTIILLRGTHGETLFTHDPQLVKALSLIIKEIISKFYTEGNFFIDIDGSVEKSIRETKKKAEIAGNRVLSLEKPYYFKNLTAFERLIIHQYFSKRDIFVTKSTGEREDRVLAINTK